MENYWEKKSFFFTPLTKQWCIFFFFSSFCNARSARDRFWSQSNWFYQLISLVFLRSQITNVVQSLILTLVLITFLSTPQFGLENSIVFGEFLEIFFFFVLNWHFFLRIWENLKLLPRPKFEAHWRKNIALSLREPGFAQQTGLGSPTRPVRGGLG